MLKTPDGGGGLDEAIARPALTVSAANRQGLALRVLAPNSSSGRLARALWR